MIYIHIHIYICTYSYIYTYLCIAIKRNFLQEFDLIQTSERAVSSHQMLKLEAFRAGTWKGKMENKNQLEPTGLSPSPQDEL